MYIYLEIGVMQLYILLYGDKFLFIFVSMLIYMGKRMFFTLIHVD